MLRFITLNVVTTNEQAVIELFGIIVVVGLVFCLCGIVALGILFFTSMIDGPRHQDPPMGTPGQQMDKNFDLNDIPRGSRSEVLHVDVDKPREEEIASENSDQSKSKSKKKRKDRSHKKSRSKRSRSEKLMNSGKICKSRSEKSLRTAIEMESSGRRSEGSEKKMKTAEEPEVTAIIE